MAVAVDGRSRAAGWRCAACATKPCTTAGFCASPFVMYTSHQYINSNSTSPTAFISASTTAARAVASSAASAGAAASTVASAGVAGHAAL